MGAGHRLLRRLGLNGVAPVPLRRSGKGVGAGVLTGHQAAGMPDSPEWRNVRWVSTPEHLMSRSGAPLLRVYGREARTPPQERGSER